MTTRNLTISLPDELVRRAKVLAAERDTSLSALVGDLLRELLGAGDSYAQAWADEEAVMAEGPLLVGEVTWTREDLHRR